MDDYHFGYYIAEKKNTDSQSALEPLLVGPTVAC
jgi:hypothetical protein